MERKFTDSTDTTTFTVLYDACVLYPESLRDFLMRLAVTDVFRARWTDQIHDEWTRNLLEKRPDLKKERIERTRNLMNHHVRDGLVTDYEFLIDELDLPDPDDRHVLAAAIRADANVIVTFNLDHFPSNCLAPYGVVAQHPDDFVMRLLDRSPGAVCTAARRHRGSLHNPAKTVDEYLDSLARQQLSQTVVRLASFASVL